MSTLQCTGTINLGQFLEFQRMGCAHGRHISRYLHRTAKICTASNEDRQQCAHDKTSTNSQKLPHRLIPQESKKRRRASMQKAYRISVGFLVELVAPQSTHLLVQFPRSAPGLALPLARVELSPRASSPPSHEFCRMQLEKDQGRCKCFHRLSPAVLP